MADVPERVKTRTELVEEAINAALDRKWKEALEINREVAERYGVDEETHNRLGKAYTELGQLDDALSAYRATLELNPLNSEARLSLGRLYLLQNQPRAAIPQLEEATRLMPICRS